jgi:hypothetical protein
MNHAHLPSSDVVQLPTPPLPPVDPDCFVLMPLGPGAGSDTLVQVYRATLEQAREVARPSLPERDLLAVWN